MRFLLIAVLIIFAGCSTLDQEVINNPDIKIKPDPLSLEMDYEVYHLRADLVRIYKPEDEVKKAESIEDKYLPYYYIGLRLGNGFFYDFNGNLAIDLIRFYNLDSDSFKFIKKKEGFAAKDHEFVRDGEEFYRIHRGLFKTSEKVVFFSDFVQVSAGLISTKVIIRKNETQIYAESSGITSTMDPGIIYKISDVEYKLYKPWEYNFIRVTNRIITYGDELQIILEDNLITFNYNGLNNIYKRYYFFRTENGFYFYDEKFSGVHAEKIGNVINVYKNEKLEYTVTIEK